MNPITRNLRNYDFGIAAGSSGTILNLANIIDNSSNGGTSERLNNFMFTRDQLMDAVDRILEAKTAKQRTKIPGLDPARADIMPAGAIILEQIFKELKLQTLTVSEYALREGVIFDTIESLSKVKGKDHLDDIRYKSVIHLAETFKYEKEHALHTAGLALKIFDETQKLHKLGDTEREYLETAAILHEIGGFISHSQHHRHSYYLIRNSELLGFTENEKEIIANVARYHRKSHPKVKHPDFAKLGSEDQMIVKKLASILRIADGLDRTHSSIVSDVKCDYSDNELKMILQSVNGSPLELEIWAAESKKALFEDTYDVKVSFAVG
jgi:exopolyphosphatase/guanosine-5'-triphosphate,3'-diphosphate pyrophosphatase